MVSFTPLVLCYPNDLRHSALCVAGTHNEVQSVNKGNNQKDVQQGKKQEWSENHIFSLNKLPQSEQKHTIQTVNGNISDLLCGSLSSNLNYCSFSFLSLSSDIYRFLQLSYSDILKKYDH